MFYDYYINQPPIWLIVSILIIMLWEMLWKGIGLWNAGKLKQKGWFIAILLLNTAGILPIIYLVFFQKKEDEKDLAHFAKAHEESLKAQLLKQSTPKKRTLRKK